MDQALSEKIQAAVYEGTGSRKELPEPTIRGEWMTWEQIGSHKVTTNIVAALKAAGVVAFFSATDRRWGVKVQTE